MNFRCKQCKRLFWFGANGYCEACLLRLAEEIAREDYELLDALDELAGDC